MITIQQNSLKIKKELVVDLDGTQAWYLNDKLHREDGPAFVLSNGDKAWFINGKKHRVDGPAIIRANGKQEWWTNGNRISDAEIKEWQEQYNIPENYSNWDTQHKMLFKLRFS